MSTTITDPFIGEEFTTWGKEWKIVGDVNGGWKFAVTKDKASNVEQLANNAGMSIRDFIESLPFQVEQANIGGISFEYKRFPSWELEKLVSADCLKQVEQHNKQRLDWEQKKREKAQNSSDQELLKKMRKDNIIVSMNNTNEIDWQEVKSKKLATSWPAEAINLYEVDDWASIDDAINQLEKACKDAIYIENNIINGNRVYIFKSGYGGEYTDDDGQYYRILAGAILLNKNIYSALGIKDVDYA